MPSKARSKGTNKKQTSARAEVHDRKLLEQAERETAEGAGPAQALRDAKAKIDEIHANAPPIPRFSTHKHPAATAAEEVGKAKEKLAELIVPMTLGEVCEIIGVDCKPERFAVTAFETLGGQLEVVTELAESSEMGGYDAYRFTENLRRRMLLAGRVTAWLESEKPLASLPEVQP